MHKKKAIISKHHKLETTRSSNQTSSESLVWSAREEFIPDIKGILLKEFLFTFGKMHESTIVMEVSWEDWYPFSWIVKLSTNPLEQLRSISSILTFRWRIFVSLVSLYFVFLFIHIYSWHVTKCTKCSEQVYKAAFFDWQVTKTLTLAFWKWGLYLTEQLRETAQAGIWLF